MTWMGTQVERALAEKRRVVGKNGFNKKRCTSRQGRAACVDQELVNTRRSLFTPEECFSSEP